MDKTTNLLGYKRLIIDYHFSDFVPGTLAQADAAGTVAACLETGADSVLVYAKDHWGHCYYATEKYPRHPNVPQDLFGETLAGLSAAELTGYAYFSVGWDEHTVRAHPDWALRDADGRPIRRGASPENRVTGRWTYLCLNSPYRQYALAQIEEIVSRYDFPALFLDIVFLLPHYPPCACEHCQTAWGKEHDGPIPDAYTPDYLDFVFAGYGRFFREVKAIIAAAGKDVQITHNFGLPYDEDDYVAFEINTLGRNFLRGSALAKIMRAEAHGRTVELIGHRFNQDWDFVTKPPTLMRWEAATVLAHNCALMWVDQPNMNGRFDPKAIAAIKAAFETVDDLLPFMRDTKPVAEIALLYPTRSFLMQPEEELGFVGAYRMLTELHWPFDVVTEDTLTVDSLIGFQLLIVPHATYLLPQTVTAVSQYLQNGGHLLTTGHAAALLQVAELDDNLPYPVAFIRPGDEYDLHTTYLRVENPAALLPWHDDQVRVVYTAPNIAVTSEQWVSHNVAPGQETTLAAVVSGRMGDGRYTLIAPRLFADAMRQSVPAYRQYAAALMGELVDLSLWVDAPTAVEVTYNYRGHELIICLVNGLGSRPVSGGILYQADTPGHQMLEEVIPVHDIQIHLRHAFINQVQDQTGRDLTMTHPGGDLSHTIIFLERMEQTAVVRLEVDKIPGRL